MTPFPFFQNDDEEIMYRQAVARKAESRIPEMTEDHYASVFTAKEQSLRNGYHRSAARVDDVLALIKSVASGESRIVSTAEIQQAFRMMELGNFHGAREILAGWLSSSPAPTDCEGSCGNPAHLPDAPAPINQCDGCQRGLPVKDGIHYGEGYDMIGCTADRYSDEAELDDTHRKLLAAINRYGRAESEVARLTRALERITEGRGRFSRDQLTFATNVIEDMKRIAIEALTPPTGDPIDG